MNLGWWLLLFFPWFIAEEHVNSGWGDLNWIPFHAFCSMLELRIWVLCNPCLCPSSYIWRFLSSPWRFACWANEKRKRQSVFEFWVLPPVATGMNLVTPHMCLCWCQQGTEGPGVLSLQKASFVSCSCRKWKWWTDGWLDGKMDGCIDGWWMGGLWMDGWMMDV